MRKNLLGKTLKNAGRLKKIVSVFAKNGFEDLAQRAKLGRFIIGKLSSFNSQDLSIETRLRICFEELGPTFVKLGQLLASRPDLIPNSYCEEFKRLHANVKAIPYSEIKSVLEDEYGESFEKKFKFIDEKEIGAASIAQVYKAQLIDGTAVVLKVQRPGIIETINEDLGVIYNIAELLDKYVPETRVFNLIGIVDEFFKNLELETNFYVEANNIRRFKENFKDEPTVVIPKVFEEYSGERVLVMEMLQGLPLSSSESFMQEGVDADKIIRIGLKSYFKMVFRDGLFHGDMHPGNMFILPNNKLGLIDFGMVGRLNSKTQTSIANMMMALVTEDYDRLALEYIELSPYTEHVDLDRFSRQLKNLLAPFYGLTLKEVNTGKLLLASTSIAAKNKLVLPSELVLFFKSIISVESIGKMIKEDFDVLAYSMDFAVELIQAKYDSKKIKKDVGIMLRDFSRLLLTTPWQLKQILRKWNNPDHAHRVEIKELVKIRNSISNSANLLFLGIIIGCLILSGSLTASVESDYTFLDLPVISATLYGFAGFLSLISFYHYIRK